MARQSRTWVFTINNPANNDLPLEWPSVKYCIWQREQGASGTQHLQGYVIFAAPRRLTSVRLLNGTAHWEPRRGTHVQARDYASKDDTRIAGPFTFGEEPAQGSRSDIREALEAVKEGATDLELIETFPSTWVRYNRALSTYRNLLPVPPRETPSILIVYGPSRSGKSSVVQEGYPNAYWKDKGKWWDGYSGQSTIVFDEFYGWYSYHGLNRLLDVYPLRVECKGSTVPMRASTFIFTSNKHPKDWYSGVNDPSHALLHRFLDWAQILHGPSPPGTWEWQQIEIPETTSAPTSWHYGNSHLFHGVHPYRDTAF